MTTAVRDNHGYVYEARVLQTGDAYGNGAKWKHAAPGITIDGNAPGTWFAATIAEFPTDGTRLALDYGQDWMLDADSTLKVVALALAAVSPEVA